MAGPVYKRAAELLEAEVGDELVALDARAGTCFSLTPVAASVWHSLEQPKTFDQLTDQLLAEYAVSRDQCTTELRELLDDLAREGLIEQASAPSPAAEGPGLQPSGTPDTATSGGKRDSARARSPEPAVSREFSLLVECCRWSFAGDNAETVHSAAGASDFARFVRLAAFHRVQGLAWHCLSSLGVKLPVDAAGALAADAERIAASNLRIAVECRRLLGAFGDRGIRLLFVKGLALGALVYPDPLLKMGWDIDILVAPPDLDAAADLLRGEDYELRMPRSAAALRHWHRHEKESLWRSARDGFHVELHTRLADNRRLIPGLGVDSPRQDIEVAPGIALPTLADDELFAYLCVHGASSAWFRLKWITDFAGLLHGRSGDEIERLYRRSQELGASRAAGQALLLSDALYATLGGSPGLRDELNASAANRWLYRAALRQLAGRTMPIEPTARPWGTTRIHLTQFLLHPGPGFKLSELTRQARYALLH